MWPFKGYKKAFQKTQRRDALLAELADGAVTNDGNKMTAALCRLMIGHAADPLLEPVLVFALDKVGKRNMEAAMGMAVYILGHRENPAAWQSVAEKSIELTARLDRQNMTDMASMAMLALAVTQSNSFFNDQTLKLWGEAMDRLETLDVANMGLAAACNAAASESPALSRLAAEKWEGVVARLGETSPQLAASLARKFEEKQKELRFRRYRDRIL